MSDRKSSTSENLSSTGKGTKPSVNSAALNLKSKEFDRAGNKTEKTTSMHPFVHNNSHFLVHKSGSDSDSKSGDNKQMSVESDSFIPKSNIHRDKWYDISDVYS